MNHKYDNSERLETVSDKQWRDALDELTAYLRWRLRGKTQRGAHSERELGMPALDYYQEEAVVKLIEGDWKWQDRFSLGKQLERIAADLITKQVQKWEREHPWLTEDGTPKSNEKCPSASWKRLSGPASIRLYPSSTQCSSLSWFSWVGVKPLGLLKSYLSRSWDRGSRAAFIRCSSCFSSRLLTSASRTVSKRSS